MSAVILFFGKYLIFIVLLALPYFWWRGKKELAIQAGLAMLLAQAIAQVVKQLFPTPRPFEVLGTVRPEVFFGTAGGVDSSFPSAHAALAVALATSVALEDQRLSLPFFVAAGLIGAARVLSLAHFWSDILGGAAIGVAAAVAVNYLLRSRFFEK